MKRRLFKSIVASMTGLSLVLTTGVSAFAADTSLSQQRIVSTNQSNNSVLSLKKDNFNYLEGKPGDTHLVYTYDSNGSTYKVVENASENFDKVNSTIYTKNNTGIFVKYATQNLTVNNSTFKLRTDENGIVTTEVQDLSSVKESDVLNNKISSRRLASGSYQGYKVSSWKHLDTIKGSNRIEKYTVTAVTAVLVYIATDAATGGLSTAAVVAIGAVANKIVDEAIPYVYYRQFYYEKKLINPPYSLKNFVVGSRWRTYYYGNSDLHGSIGHAESEVYANGYEK